MAITAANLKTVISEKTTLELEKSTIMQALCDPSWNARVQNAKGVEIPTITWAARAASADINAGRTLTWPTPTEASETFQTLSIDREFKQGNKVPVLHSSENIPRNLVERARANISRKTRQAIDADLLAEITGATYATAQNIQSTSTAANNSFDISNDKGGSNVGKLLLEQIFDYGDALISMGAVLGDGEAPSGFYCLMPVKLRRALHDYLLAQKYSYDPLTASLLERSGIFASGQYGGRLNGVDIIIQPLLPTPAAAADFNIYFGARQALAYGIRPTWTQTIAPTSDAATDLAFIVNQVTVWGQLIVHAPLLVKGGVEAIA